jgi:DNA primase catalytic core
MARYDEEFLRKLKAETDIVRLIQGYGTKLKERGSDELMGLCPVHDDHDPSLSVNRKTGEWYCHGACKKGGDVFAWVMHAENVSFRHAIELLKDGTTGTVNKRSSKPRVLECPLSTDSGDQVLLKSVIDYYHNRLKQSPSGLAYLDKRGIVHAEIIDTFQIGFVDRTLGLRLPAKTNQKGAKLREDLERLGILRDTGHEQFRGCIVFPLYAMDGTIAQIYGRRIDRGTKEGFRHFYLPSPHAGIFNAPALRAYEEIILCESVIDALTFWNHGYRNVTSTFGTNGFTDEMIEAIQNSDIKRILIAFDNDQAGNKAADEVAAMLQMLGIEVFRVKFPVGQDANEYASKVQFAKEGNGDTTLASLGLAIRNATWISSGKQEPAVTSNQTKVIRQAKGMRPEAGGNTEQPASVERLSESLPMATKIDSENRSTQGEAVPHVSRLTPQASSEPSVLAAEPASVERLSESLRMATKVDSENRSAQGEAVPHVSSLTPQASVKQQPAASPMGTVAKATIEAEVRENEILIPIGNRSYRVRGLEKNLAFDVLKVNVLVRKNEQFYIDTFDIYAARQRSIFIKEAARELMLDDETIKRDLGKVLLKLEELQDKTIADAQAIRQEKIEITDADKAAALELLKDENLLERILTDFDSCGVVGERNNKLVGFLAATSRKLAKPLAIMVQSSSAAGKSSLMEAILRFMPNEEQVTYSAMTGQSLFYMGGMNLKNKVLAISEEEGIRQASYALKLLQSEGQLTIASTGKDPGTGRMETQEYHVEGPVMLFLTTTAIDVDEELLNRCLVLTVDEDPEQTKAIQRQQREGQTLEGLLAAQRRASVAKLHQNAQRLLRPLAVVNHYAHQLQFLTDQTRRRRDHVKYLTLIQAVALVHQYQREVKAIQVEGETVQYIEVTPRDIQIANQLANYVLGRSVDELAPQTRRLLLQLWELVRKECEGQQIEQSEYRFTRRFIRERLKWGATQLRIHLDRLVEMEYVVQHTAGRGRVTMYELLFDGRGREGELTLCGLIDPSTLVDPHARSPEREDKMITPHNLAGQKANIAELSANVAETMNNLAENVEKVADASDSLAEPKRGQNGHVTESISETLPDENMGEASIDEQTSKDAHQEAEEMKRKAS